MAPGVAERPSDSQAAGFFHLCVAGLARGAHRQRAALFVLAVVANVLYCAAYVADVFIQLSGFRARRGRWRLVLLVVGCAFAAALTHLMSIGVFMERHD